MKKGLVGAVLLAGSLAIAQIPVVNIPANQGELRDAQAHLVQAYQKVEQVRAKACHRSLDHIKRAKQYLEEADAELKLAAGEASTRRN